MQSNRNYMAKCVDRLTAVLVMCIAFGAGCAPSAGSNQTVEAPEYRFDEASKGGTGKFYLGREISLVMHHAGVSWLDRASREEEEHTSLLIDNLAIESDSIVADIGAGSGYFSIPIASLAPRGHVYAVDIERKMLDVLQTRASARSVTNITPILGTKDDPSLPENAIDLALVVDAYHEFSHPFEVMRKIYRGLKPDGRVVLVEYRAEDPRIPILRLHKMTQAQVKKEMSAAGFKWIETRDVLPRQHFMVFAKS